MKPFQNAALLVTLFCALVGFLPSNAAEAEMLFLLDPSGMAADRIASEESDGAAVELLNQFMTSLLITEEDKRLKAVLPLVHKSLLNNAGSDLNGTVKDYSYKKAAKGVGLYKVPVRVTRVAKGRNSTVGYGKTAEKGRTDRYFVAKRDGVAGPPAPIHVFFPKDGGKPKIVDMGSL